MHVALRCPKGKSLYVDGEDVVPAVHNVLEKVHAVNIKLKIPKRHYEVNELKTIRLMVSLRG